MTEIVKRIETVDNLLNEKQLDVRLLDVNIRMLCWPFECPESKRIMGP